MQLLPTRHRVHGTVATAHPRLLDIRARRCSRPSIGTCPIQEREKCIVPVYDTRLSDPTSLSRNDPIKQLCNSSRAFWPEASRTGRRKTRKEQGTSFEVAAPESRERSDRVFGGKLNYLKLYGAGSPSVDCAPDSNGQDRGELETDRLQQESQVGLPVSNILTQSEHRRITLSGVFST